MVNQAGLSFALILSHTYQPMILFLVNLKSLIRLFLILNFLYQVDRSGTRSTVVPVKVEKDSSWQDAIYNFCIDSLEADQIPNPQVIIGLSDCLLLNEHFSLLMQLYISVSSRR